MAKDRWEDVKLCEERLAAYQFTARELRAAAATLSSQAARSEAAAGQYRDWIAHLRRNGGIAVVEPPATVAEDMKFKR